MRCLARLKRRCIRHHACPGLLPRLAPLLLLPRAKHRHWVRIEGRLHVARYSIVSPRGRCHRPPLQPRSHELRLFAKVGREARRSHVVVIQPKSLLDHRLLRLDAGLSVKLACFRRQFGFHRDLALSPLFPDLLNLGELLAVVWVFQLLK